LTWLLELSPFKTLKLKLRTSTFNTMYFTRKLKPVIASYCMEVVNTTQSDKQRFVLTVCMLTITMFTIGNIYSIVSNAVPLRCHDTCCFYMYLEQSIDTHILSRHRKRKLTIGCQINTDVKLPTKVLRLKIRVLLSIEKCPLYPEGFSRIRGITSVYLEHTDLEMISKI